MEIPGAARNDKGSEEENWKQLWEESERGKLETESLRKSKKDAERKIKERETRDFRKEFLVPTIYPGI